jgi:methionyl-tRNA formyltransferase
MNKQNKIKTIFMGTPDFGLPSLKALLKSDFFEINAVITNPDKKIGRKRELNQSPIKKEALKNKIKVLQPLKIIDVFEIIKNINPDLIVVIAYGEIIPEKILNLPKYGSVNIHGSLLPKYRGAACVQAAILNNEKESGVTIMKMEKGLDCGPILHKEKIKIDANETAESLYCKLSSLAGRIIIKILKEYIKDEIKPIKQKECEAIYIKKICKHDGEININKTAEEIERLIRAMTPWPGAYIKKNNKIIKIIEANSEIKKINKYRIGDFFVKDEKLFLQCKKDSLEIIKIQPEGKKILNYSDFIRGYKNLIA